MGPAKKQTDPCPPAPAEAVGRLTPTFNPFTDWIRFHLCLMEMTQKLWAASLAAAPDADRAKVAADRREK